jgi:hypothetical protein
MARGLKGCREHRLALEGWLLQVTARPDGDEIQELALTLPHSPELPSWRRIHPRNSSGLPVCPTGNGG